LAAKGGKPDQLMIDATYLKAHRTAASLLKKGLFPDVLGRTKDGLNSKLHVVCDGKGRPLIMLLSEGQMSDYQGAALMIDVFPKAKVLLGDKGYDADWFRAALGEREIIPASRPRRTERCRSLTIPRSTASDTRSRTCSAGSRTGVVSIPATIVAPTVSCQPSASR
jgi:transposase